MDIEFHVRAQLYDFTNKLDKVAVILSDIILVVSYNFVKILEINISLSNLSSYTPENTIPVFVYTRVWKEFYDSANQNVSNYVFFNWA